MVKCVHGREEIAAVVKVLQNSTQMGKNVSQLEKKIAKMFNKKFGIMLNSASSALFIAFDKHSKRFRNNNSGTYFWNHSFLK